MGSPESALLADQKPAAARTLWRPYLMSLCDAEKPIGSPGKLLSTSSYETVDFGGS